MAFFLLFTCLTIINNFHLIQAVPIKEQKIVEGHVATVAQFPYISSLRDDKGHLCGGAIIDKRWILTAAHCVDFYKSPSEVFVHVGTNKLDEIGEVYNVSKIIIHRNWNIINIINDIAMLKLSKDIIFNEKVQKIDISRSEIPGGEFVTISGWGITEYPSEFASNELKYLNQSIVSYNQCLVELLPFQVHGSNLCAKSQMGGICSGDSGSPLVYKNKVIGIASWVMPCGIGYPDIYTKVSFFSSWIQNNLLNK